ncbi:unknown similar to AMEV098 [Choristoneura rosaceana entomopoxvirus 'L']|uniref:Uncharacterized protein n=1 Tax=Choristoneura rosaceana entomopoxvirus 'L' TaxID=1293539 RepID=A0ABM9QKE9_9POXV|nr:unknown similar to AMEV098 [Choristoneura rosaceana entomopoxvirus 'L']CCU56022.1 unknown similar to AMEV098 [Choristoneura rosaceana entomopoxvirus 'L']
MNEDNISKHLSVLGFMDDNKLNALLNSKIGGSTNDYLKDHKWYKLNNTNLSALVYENNGKKFTAKMHMNKDIDDNMGINDVDAYGGESKKRKTNPKNVKNNNKLVNENPSGNGRRKKNVKNTATSLNKSSDYSTDLMGDFNNTSS